MIEFTMTMEHLKLLRHAYVEWEGDEEYGVPVINKKRPYGNSDVASDVARLTGIDYDATSERPEWNAVRGRLFKLHRETETALQIVVCTGSFEPGQYVKEQSYNNLSWRRKGIDPTRPDERAAGNVHVNVTRDQLVKEEGAEEVVIGLLEVVRLAMSDSYWAIDGRVAAARKLLGDRFPSDQALADRHRRRF